MSSLVSGFLFVVLCSAPVLGQEKPVSSPEKAVCTVCAARQAHEEIAAEKVMGTSRYAGRDYFFCSEDCKGSFGADPLSYVPPELPRPAPAFAVQSLQGVDVALPSLRGQVVLLDLWATWCKPCHAMLPVLDALYRELGGRGFTVMGISIDDPKEAKDKVAKFLAKKPVAYPVYLDVRTPAAWEALHVAAIPAMFLVDRSGQIVAQWAGKIDAATVRAAVLQALAPAEER